ncbi:general transcription factor II-I repeat domain-containing protein 2A-like [Stigmatopora argus]
MSLSKPAVKRKVGDEHRQFQEKWGVQYFFVEHRGTPTCLIYTEKVAVHKEYNLKRNCTTRHAEEYEKYQGDERANQVASLKTRLLRQQDLFKKATKDSNAAVKASYAVCELIDPVLSDPKWLMDLAFLVDITHDLNVLNKKLQGQGQLVSAAYDNVRAFCTKLVLWKAQLSQTNLCHFPACKALVDAGTPFSGEKYAEAISKLQEEFDHRFADFKTHKATFQIFADPFSFDVQDAPPELQMELIDLQCNSALKAKFREVSGEADKLGQFLRELTPSFPELSRRFKRTMCLFGSTYLCEKLFSTLNFNKSKYRSRLTDEHLQALLRVSTASSLKPNVTM